jgi:hypothetical protein
MNIKERYDALIVHFSGGNKSAFAKKIKVGDTVIQNIIGKRQTNPSFEVLEKTIFAFENLNADWLLTGRGEMLVTRNEGLVDFSELCMKLMNERDKKITDLAIELGACREQYKNLQKRLGEGYHIAAEPEG